MALELYKYEEIGHKNNRIQQNYGILKNSQVFMHIKMQMGKTK